MEIPVPTSPARQRPAGCRSAAPRWAEPARRPDLGVGSATRWGTAAPSIRGLQGGQGDGFPRGGGPSALGLAGVGLLRPLTAADLSRGDLGRTHRLPSLALRELLGTIDGERCRFPGCTRRRKLHAHHVRYWSEGGNTDLANLLLLCGRHHTLVHAEGFRLTLDPDRTLAVTTRDGAPVPHFPPLPWGDPGELDPTGTIGGDTLPRTRSRPAWTSTTSSASCAAGRTSDVL